MFSGPTISERIQAANGHPSGFDYLRIFLAITILIRHCAVYSDIGVRRLLEFGPLDELKFISVPMFFSLSGFLVAGSLERTRSLVTFLGLRTFRIFPALLVDTLFSALILGPVFTVLPLQDYFSAHEFKVYFLNIIGDIHYHLPGVFLSNPDSNVNGQLWTIPFELYAYISLSLMAVCGLFRRRWLVLAVAVVVQLVMMVYLVRIGHWVTASTSTVLPCFFFGLVFYRFRDSIPCNGALFTAAVAGLFLTRMVQPLFFLMPIPTLYITIYFGVLNPRKIWLIRSGDYSYALYLYSLPIIQAIIAGLPAARHFAVLAPIALVVCFCFAAASWHLVEKQVLKCRYLLYDLEARRLRSV